MPRRSRRRPIPAGRAFEARPIVGGPARIEDVEPLDEAEVGTHFIEIELVDMVGEPIGGERYRVALPDGQVREGSLDGSGRARIDRIAQGGTCRVTFPRLDAEAWERVAS